MKNTTIKTDKKNQSYGQIMEIKINSTETADVLACVEDFISHNRKFYIVTPNPELILMAQENKSLKIALNGADISIPDGIGLSQAAKFSSLWLPKNVVLRFIVGLLQGLRVGAATFFDKKWLTQEFQPIKGRELFLELIKLSARKGWKVFLLGGLGNEAELATRKLQVTNSKQSSNHKLQIESNPGPKLDKDAMPLTQKDVQIEKQVIDKINKFAPELLFVAFGNPKQEIWVHEHLKDLKIGGAMVVGGTLRYVAGFSKLPPKWMAEIGLEWLWRVFTEPKRIGRIFRAVIIFPIKIFFFKITGNKRLSR